MKLYTLGPVEMYDETMEIGGKQVPYFRTDEFSEVVQDITLRLKKLLKADTNSEIVFLTASGTAAMEAALINCFTEKDRLLVIDGGSFGHRFVELCEIHKVPYNAVSLEWGECLSLAKLEAAAQGAEYTGLLVNLHESGTGQLYDVEMLSSYCKQHNMLFVVDAISAFLADSVEMKRFGMDAVILSSQKAISLAPGLSLVALSPRMLAERVEKIDPRSMYFNFKAYIENGHRGQTPFTPAVRLIYELQKMTRILESEGIERVIDRTRAIAMDFREQISQIGLDHPSYPLSNAATPVLFPDNCAKEVYKELKEQYGMIVNPSGGQLGEKMFRVAHIGNHKIEDNIQLVNAIKEIIERR